MKRTKIPRRTFLKGTAALLPAALAPLPSPASREKKRNVKKAPNLDGFAAQSLDLTRACSTRPLCSPHKAMLVTGKSSPSTGVWSNRTSRDPWIGA